MAQTYGRTEGQVITHTATKSSKNGLFEIFFDEKTPFLTYEKKQFFENVCLKLSGK